MSFSTGFKEGMQNPCKIFIEFKPDEGKFKYWDKEQKENIEVSLEQFIILDDNLFTITGYSKELDTGVFSNEVRNVKNDVITVCYRPKKGTTRQELFKGTYENIKADVNNLVGRSGYTASVYILVPKCYIGGEGNEWVIANIKFVASSLNTWINFRNENRNKFSTNSVCFTGTTDKTKKAGKSTIEWTEPILELGKELNDNLKEIAKEEDIHLQEYLSEYLKADTPNDPLDQTPEFNPEDEDQTIPEDESKQEVKEEDKVTEEEPDQSWSNHDTDGWKEYKTRKGLLGDLSIKDLKGMQTILEDREQDGWEKSWVSCESYHMILRAIAEKHKEQKEQPKSGGNPFADDDEQSHQPPI